MLLEKLVFVVYDNCEKENTFPQIMTKHTDLHDLSGFVENPPEKMKSNV